MGISQSLLTWRDCPGSGNSVLRSMLFNYLVINPLRTALYKHCAVFSRGWGGMRRQFIDQVRLGVTDKFLRMLECARRWARLRDSRSILPIDSELSCKTLASFRCKGHFNILVLFQVKCRGQYQGPKSSSGNTVLRNLLGKHYAGNGLIVGQGFLGGTLSLFWVNIWWNSEFVVW